jgi:predicted TPR repeat methyltransferase
MAAAPGDACNCIDGVDLSAGMLSRARRKGCYNRLEQAEIIAFPDDEPDAGADLVVAADQRAGMLALRWEWTCAMPGFVGVLEKRCDPD